MVFRILFCIAFCCTFLLGTAQNKVFRYPLTIDNRLLKSSSFDAYYLDNSLYRTFSLVIKNDKKVEYLLVDQSFNILRNINVDVDNSIFDIKGLKYYTGGTASGNRFHFVYPVGKNSFEMETVDFNTKSTSHKTIAELSKGQKLVTSFSDNSMFYLISANDETGELSITTLNGKAETAQKSFIFPTGGSTDKKGEKLSTYLKDFKLVKSEEASDMSTAIKPVKLFSFPGKLVFLTNNGDEPAQVVIIKVPELTIEIKRVDYSSLISPDEKGKVYVSSFIRNDKLFSLVLNKKNIRIIINDLKSERLLRKLEINEDTNQDLFAEGPLTQNQMGARDDSKDVTDIKRLIKLLTKGTEGIMVTENNAGQLVVTAGTFDYSHKKTDNGEWVGGNKWVNNHAGYSDMLVYDPFMYYRPGIPSYLRERYYISTYFRLLLDPESLLTIKGNVMDPMSDQIKNYLRNVKQSGYGACQFSMNGNQYLGYYNEDMRCYIIEQIKISR